jgi:hypothetical protein
MLSRFREQAVACQDELGAGVQLIASRARLAALAGHTAVIKRWYPAFVVGWDSNHSAHIEPRREQIADGALFCWRCRPREQATATYS